MDRRTAVAQLLGGTEELNRVAQAKADSPPGNTSPPVVLRTTAGLEPYTGPWGTSQILHLLRRTTFGPAPADIAALSGLTMSQAVDLLLADPPPELSLPLNVSSTDFVPIGETWVNAIFRDPNATSSPTTVRKSSLKAWWLDLLVNQSLSLREKMVLFWHNHFVTEIDTVNDPRYSYRYLDFLRRNAWGNFRDLAKQMSIDGAMLIYLNGNSNTRTSPNENFARELQELFTIGKGPEIAPGDYTNYTEVDVRAAARVLTGWRTLAQPDGTIAQINWRFDTTRHDTNDKQFSHAYGNAVISGRSGADGALELDDLINMIFAQPATALYLCRKLYRWFVYYLIDAPTETSIITPMANLLRANNYQVRPVLSLLLKSAHFFDAVNMGCMIKSPLDFAVGLCRQTGMAFPQSDVAKRYALLTYLVNQASGMQQNIGEPPDVAGWPSYYQTPQFNQIWINSDTLPRRTALTDRLAGRGYTTSGTTLIIDPIAVIQAQSNPADPNILINDLCTLFYPFPVTAGQKAFFKETLIPGLPDYEWTVEWADFLGDPGNTQKRTAVATKIQAMLTVMFKMPEYQLQ